MKSKIEKLERIPDDKRYYDESDFVKEVIEKINMIIDYLNSQPEEKKNEFYVGDSIERTDYTGYPYSEKFQSTTKDTPEEEETVEIYNPVTDTTYRIKKKQDTPEEWERLRRDGALAFYIELEDWLYEKGYAKDGEIKVPTEVFMRFVAKELKLNSKKK